MCAPYSLIVSQLSTRFTLNLLDSSVVLSVVLSVVSGMQGLLKRRLQVVTDSHHTIIILWARWIL